ncbi:MAG: V-type ATP synthase subunit E [Clostridia bacterium]|nr:V-type ATP synthase subunit E [Clostridia bacterium]
MAELEKLTGYIIQKANDDAALIKEKAKADYDTAVNAATAEADKLSRDIISKANDEAVLIEQRANSALTQKKSRAILALKNSAVETVISDAKDMIISMGDSDYSAFMLRVLDANATGDEGIIAFNENDSKRMSKEFTTAVKKHKLTMSDEYSNITGGFILKYGAVEINCSVEALFRDRAEEFTDYINKALFE